MSFTKRITSFFAVIAVLYSSLSVAVVSFEREIIIEDDFEPKKYSNATLADNFCGSTVLVVMDKSLSEINRVHDKSFFGGVELEEIQDLTIVYNENLLCSTDERPLTTQSNRAIVEHYKETTIQQIQAIR